MNKALVVALRRLSVLHCQQAAALLVYLRRVDLVTTLATH